MFAGQGLLVPSPEEFGNQFVMLPTPEGMGYALSSRGGEGGAKARGALGVPPFRKKRRKDGAPEEVGDPNGKVRPG